MTDTRQAIITPEFARALAEVELLSSKRRRLHSVFIEGGAGSGKSTLLKLLQERHPDAVVLAPTGAAATQVGGSTLHRMFQFPPKVLEPQLDRSHSYPSPVLRKTKKVFVDESGMVRADMVDAMDYYLRSMTRRSTPFGGVAVVFLGDLYQLPPIVKEEEKGILFDRLGYQSEYFFSAKVWQTHGLHRVPLTRVFRQADQRFVELLDRMRRGLVTNEDLEMLNSRVGLTPPKHITVLAARREQVERINAASIEALPGRLEIFKGSLSGTMREEDVQAPKELCLKEGAVVMMLNNHPAGEWSNGTVGVYEGMSSGKMLVRTKDGTLHQVGKHTWEKKSYRSSPDGASITQVVVGRMSQYPVKVAYAITIHKSQGQTLTEAVLDLGSGAFVRGQPYVGLSRLTSLSGLYLSAPLRREDCMCDERVTAFLEGRPIPSAGAGPRWERAEVKSVPFALESEVLPAGEVDVGGGYKL